jgi:uncharacterized membrane protein
MGVIKNKGKGQSFFSWFLWLILDIVLFIPTLGKDGKSIFMLMASMLGSIFISFLLLKIKKVKWKENEWISLSLILLTLVIWAVSSDKNVVIIFGIISQIIAGWPLTKESWLDPRPKWTLVGYLLFVLGCIFLLTLENNVFTKFKLEDHLFPIALGLQTIVDIIPLVRKSLEKRP